MYIHLMNCFIIKCVTFSLCHFRKITFGFDYSVTVATIILHFFFNLFPFPASCLDRYGLIHQARISASVNAMRVLNTGTEVEAAVADALVSCY